jgi:hypothetical protein
MKFPLVFATLALLLSFIAVVVALSSPANLPDYIKVRGLAIVDAQGQEVVKMFVAADGAGRIRTYDR